MLGLTIVLIERGANDTSWFSNLANTYYYGDKIMDSIRNLTKSAIFPFCRDFTTYVEEKESVVATASQANPTDIHREFIVHGSEEAPRETVARFITKIGLNPVILHEQASHGKTIIEKLIDNSNVGYAVVLLTPDDLGRGKQESEEKPRARQNVILELGYFVGLLGRERVAALIEGNVEIPSDLMGVVYISYDNEGGWRQKLAKELLAADYEIDGNKVLQ